MQQTSDLFKELYAAYMDGAQNVRFETSVEIGRPSVLVDEAGSAITFGNVRIIVSSAESADGYGADQLISVGTKNQLFPEALPGAGNCISAEIDLTLRRPNAEISRQAQIKPFIRLTDGTRHTEWIQKGVFYIDTRSEKESGSKDKRLTIHGYDAMLKAEQNYPSSTLSWPATDISVVREICSYLGFELDDRTVAAMTKGYKVQLPTGYSCREVLGYIAAMYGGNFVMSDLGRLLLVQIGVEPAATVDLGRRMRSFSSTEALAGYERVELVVNDDEAFYAGSSSGRTMTVECPWGTQAMANALLAQFQGFRYQPFTAENAILDPAAELGDGVTANGVTGMICAMDLTFGSGFRGTVSAPWEEELDHEYPYVPKQDRKIRRQLRGLTTDLVVQAGKIEAKVSRTGGEESSFGWNLTDTEWTVSANNATVLKASKTGLEVYGKITATSGAIGGFTIEDGYLSTKGQTWGGDEYYGIYIGPEGIQLGENFSVSRSGYLKASSGEFTGAVYAGMISWDGDAGYFSGEGLETYTVTGWGGSDQIDWSTLSEQNFMDGVNESLANADWAAGVLSGAESAEWLGAVTVATNDLDVSDTIWYGGHQLYLGSFPDGNGTIQRCVQWYD